LEEVAASLNQPGSPPRVLFYPHDVACFDEVPSLFEAIVHDMGGLDLIVYVAGIQPTVELHEYDFAKDEATIKVNLLGAIAWLNQAAGRFERTRGGQIAAVSSIAGDRGRVGSPVYNTSKAALNTYLEALRNRLSRYGVTVTTLKSGFVDTRLLANAARTFWVVSPQTAAGQMVEAIEARKQMVYIPGRWRWVGLIVQLIPSFIFRRLRF
jgi:NAD(P)-dependent dehydrogenase (short-subunit alcohol dehydrogenase family)